MITHSEAEKFAALDHSEEDSALAPHDLRGLAEEIINVFEHANGVQYHPEEISPIGLSGLGEEFNIVRLEPFGEDEATFSGHRRLRENAAMAFPHFTTGKLIKSSG
ncbi:hypothetical protein RUND412_001450 [Rhizina undulata]